VCVIEDGLFWTVIAVVGVALVLATMFRLRSRKRMSLLDDLTVRGAQVRIRLLDLVARHGYRDTTKNFLLMAYVDLALEHHEAIWRLIDVKLYGSAFALVRPLWDPMLRGHWINKIASPEEIEQAWHDDEFKFPHTDKLLADIKREYLAPTQPGASDVPPEQADLFILLLKDDWKALCSYTHSGPLQLSRRFNFTEGHVRRNYSDDDIVQALKLATAALFLLLNMFFVSMEKPDEAKEVRTMLQQYTDEFKDRFRAGGVG
jgi:hypothetical protein